MAKTYTITSTSINGGSTSSPGNHFDSYYATDANGRMIGYSSSFYRAVNIMFSSSDLAQFSGKTITGIKLKITTVNSGYIPSTNYAYRVRFKANGTATGTASSHAWQCTSDDTDLATLSASSRQSVASGTVYTLSVGTTLPTYGYIIGITNQGNAYLTLTSSATLEVTTNETEKTIKLSYNNNGGSGTPSAQTITTTGSSATFTVNPSSTSVTKTGHSFLGWSTSSSATTASYQNGSSITISANTTLYAVWQANTYTVSYNKGSHGTGTNTSDTKTYNVALTLKGAIFTRDGYAQDGWSTTDGGAVAYSLGASYTANSSVTLYPHWKATTSYISASNGTLGTEMTIGIVRYNNSYTHTVTYKYGTQTGTVGTGIATSVNWTPQLAWASEFVNSASGTCELTCITFDGTTELGRTTTNITLSIPSSVKCEVSSVALSETVASVASKFSAFVQSKSKIAVTGTVSTSNAYGASVQSYSISINGQTLTANGAVTGLIASNGTLSYSFTITDSRGRTDTYSGTYNVLQYTAPTINAQIQRNSSTPSSIDISYSWTVSDVNNLNDKQLVIKHRPFGGGTETTVATITPATYSGTGTYTIPNMDTDTAYEVLLELSDYFTTILTSSGVSALGNRIFGISHADQTIARHGDSPADGWDHQYFKERFHDDVDVLGDLTVNSNPVVLTVNNTAPDANGNVSLDADDVGAVPESGGTFSGDVTFSGAITITNGDLSKVGTVHTPTPGAVTLPNGTWTTVCSQEVDPGLYIVFYKVRFPNDSTGLRKSNLSTSADSSSSLGAAYDDCTSAISGDYTFCGAVGLYRASSTSTIYVNAYQTSGSSMSNVYGRLQAIRIIG